MGLQLKENPFGMRESTEKNSSGMQTKLSIEKVHAGRYKFRVISFVTTNAYFDFFLTRWERQKLTILES